MSDLTPDVLEIIDSRVIGSRTPPQGGIINIVEHHVRCFDNVVYTCYSQSTYMHGRKEMTAFYGFSAIDNDDTQPMSPVDARANS